MEQTLADKKVAILIGNMLQESLEFAPPGHARDLIMDNVLHPLFLPFIFH